MTEPQRYGRLLPLVCLAVVIGMLGLHHWYVITEGRASGMALFLLPPLGMLALGGLVYPPILFSIGKHRKDLPIAVRAIGILLAISGLGIGFYLFKYVYQF